MKKVTITFLYSEEKNKDDNYYRDKAFDEIYNSDDTIDISHAEVNNENN